MKKRVSMQDIADRLGITKVSVSKALGGYQDISDELRKKIMDTAHEMGYVPTKRNIRNKAYNFGFIVAKRFFLEADRFYNVIYYYLNMITMEADHNLSLFVISAEEEMGEVPFSAMNKEGLNGIFLSGQFKKTYLDSLLKWATVPIVFLDFYIDDMDGDFVLADNYQIGYQATMHLIKHGHREIGFVGDKFSTTSIADRYFGFVKALTMNNLPLKDEWVIINNNPRTNEYFFDVALSEQLPTSFVCNCDMAAYFLSMTLEHKGFKIPEDISLISFDNTKITPVSVKSFTTFDIGRREIAQTALSIMLHRVARDDSNVGRHYVHSHIVLGDSVMNRCPQAGTS